MDFDYQMIKDSEMRQREALLKSLPVPQSRQTPASRVPPVKPRRSIKSRPTPREETGSSSQSVNNREGEVQRVSPALTLVGAPGALEPLSPSLRAHTLLWFQRSQLPRLSRPGLPMPCWLHGFATRREAEELLKEEIEGCFLVRLSESKIGFVLSYRGRDRCRHFIIEEEVGGAADGGGHYLIAGEESRHGSLQELVNYYTHHPVGPFNEVLTTPCMKGKRGGEDLAPQGAAGPVVSGGGDTRGVIEEQPSVTSSGPPAPETTPDPLGCTAASTETAQYAVVRKGLKKSHSLPETATVEDSEVPNFIPTPPPEPVDPESVPSEAESANAQYARVNKPPKTSANAPPPSSADAHPGPQPEPQAGLSRRGSGGEQKYWEMVPMHTYEETDHLTHRAESQDQIDFYAMGRRRDIEGTQGASQNHLYSEVNLRGLQEASAPMPIPPPVRITPGLPLRPPPRMTESPSHLESTLQRLDGRLPLTPPSRASPSLPLPNNHTSIYEQIPERGLQGRPPLPPPNPPRH
ncbi:hypothetical protein AGOR_G00035010 [Albula goreensis]|uniref:SH2 domain-containing protein n=1 Tax=Albula goreensis TaxID=1534307 RepID=A0A8T3E0F6_9TELE|nr:hypothetical protein AGOR_G00035010 [Albula goreensis]